MKLKTIASAALLVAAVAGSLIGAPASAQDKVQFFPSLTGRTGPVAPLSLIHI